MKIKYISGRDIGFLFDKKNKITILLIFFVVATITHAAANNSSPSSFIKKKNSSKIELNSKQNTKKITGIVLDGATNEPIIGANIVVKGTTNGAITDVNGSFGLEVPQTEIVLVVSFVGYLTEHVSLKGESNITIKLMPDITKLDEVVVIGYGSQKRKDLTGAISHLRLDGEEELPHTNITQAIRGSIAGVNLNLDGRPGTDGTLVVRGLKSLSAGNPVLIIVDGVPWDSDLADINPNDVETIDVLKDGASAAVYGSRASNGVILITTKKGVSEKPIIRINTYYGNQGFSHKIKLLDGPKYIQKIIDYYTSQGIDNPDPRAYLQPLELANYDAGRTIDPLKVVSQPSSIESHDISISGKTAKTSYFMSGSYLDTKGLILNDNFTRISLRTNIENKVSDWVTIGLNSTFSNRKDAGVEKIGNVMNATTISPYSQIYDDQGNPLLNVHGESQALAASPIFNAKRIRDYSVKQFLTGNLFALITCPYIKGLSYRLNYSNSLNWTKHFMFDPPYYGESQNNTGTGSKEYSNEYHWLIENIIKYQKTFAEIHNIELTFVGSRDHDDYNYSLLSASNFTTDVFGYNLLQAGTIPSVSTTATANNSISMMGRINYRLKDRYMISLVTRRDGYSAFGAGKKFGVFPSLGLGWVASEEDFLKKIKVINTLKFRYSYGVTGNQAISSYSSLAQLDFAGEDTYVFGNGSATYNGIYNKFMANKNLSWETAYTSNIGVDFEILDHRIFGSLEYYHMKNKNLLLNRSIPVMNGYTSVWSNIGSTLNTGFEMTLNTVNLKTSRFNWTSTVTFSTNKNKITSLYGIDVNKDGREDDDIANNWFIGQPIGAIYDYTLNGIYQTNDVIPAGFKPGYYRIVDKNNNGVIDVGDKSIIGKVTPDFKIGFGNTFTYSNFALMVFINSSFGGKKNNEMLNPAGYFPESLNIMDAGGYWTPTNPSNSRPTIGYAMPYPHGFYESLTFVRIQDVSLSYEFPKELLSKLKIISAKIYISGKNLATITKWSGWDPEIDGSSPNVLVSRQNGYPMTRSVTAGINLSF